MRIHRENRCENIQKRIHIMCENSITKLLSQIYHWLLLSFERLQTARRELLKPIDNTTCERSFIIPTRQQTQQHTEYLY